MPKMKTKYPLLTIRGGITYKQKTLEQVDRLLADTEGELLYLLIESPGGDPAIGYRIMRMLEAKFKRIIAVIPAEAYSTATLMALGTDEIYMRKSACLGPLDIQIEHPTDGSTVSSLEIRDSLTALAGSLTTYAEDFYITLKQDFKLGKKDAADLSMRTATELVKPIAEKLDPIYLQISTRSSMLGQKYAENLLSSRMLKSSPPLARLVSRYLTNNYYYHGYAITLDEASELLALNVKDVADLEQWGKIKPVYEQHKKNDQFGVFLEFIEVEDKKANDDPSAGAKINKKGDAA